jgi:transcriptional regulatory protein RtcR
VVSKRKRRVCISLLGVKKDTNTRAAWHPTVALCSNPKLAIGRLELLHQRRYTKLAGAVADEIRQISPSINVQLRQISLGDPWDFQQVYSSLYSFAKDYVFNVEKEEYLLHITTGTQVAQICMFMLTASHHFPGKLVQSLPPAASPDSTSDSYSIIDLELSKYDQLAALIRQERRENAQLLKDGIKTKNAAFNRMIAQVEQVASASNYPILLTGPTGAGKSQLARRIYELKKRHDERLAKFVEVNCATIRGDTAMSTLFGHVKGAFTGADKPRAGLLREADGGVLFLDEIGCLGQDEQAMLLRALEIKTFYPLGSDSEVSSDFQLIAGTNSDLDAEIAAGRFRDDLLARISDWTFRLPALRERVEDIEPNLRYELNKFSMESGKEVTFTREAEQRYLDFSVSPQAQWSRNFRDLNGSVRRMATMASGGRIALEVVEAEIERLLVGWRGKPQLPEAIDRVLMDLLGEKRLSEIDTFDRFHLSGVIQVCFNSRNLSEAGRRLFNISRTQKKSPNDAARLKKYLARYELDWWQIQEAAKKR